MAKMFAQLTGVSAVAGTLDSILDNWSTNQTYGVAAKADYSGHVEMGTWKMAAQPFMRPGIDSARGRVKMNARRADSVDQLLYLITIDIREFARQYAAVDTGHMRDNIVLDNP